MSRSYDLRSNTPKTAEIENPRYEQVSPEDKSIASPHEVASPVETVGSMAAFVADSPDLQLGCSPDPPMRESDQASENSELISSEPEEIISDLHAVSSHISFDHEVECNDAQHIQDSGLTVNKSDLSKVDNNVIYTADSFTDAYWEKMEMALSLGIRQGLQSSAKTVCNDPDLSNEQSLTKEPNG